MDLLLVRCADLASDGALLPIDLVIGDDDPRVDGRARRDPLDAALSGRGERNSRRLANWLRGHAPRDLQVFSSVAKGARQMAGMIADGLDEAAGPVIVSRRLGPDAGASDILGAVGWPHDHSAALVVAHQPALGALASLLLTGQEAPLAFKKGALWWFSNRHRGGELQTVLRCALTPELFRNGGRAARNDTVDPPKSFSLDLPDVVEVVRQRLAIGVR